MEDIVQIVRDEIVAKIDRNVKVKSIVTSDELTITILLCDYKWIKKGQSLTDSESNQWSVANINYSTGEIIVLIPGDVTLVKNQILTIVEPKFQFGTVKTANDEWKLMTKKDDRQGLPLIWMAGSVPENKPVFDSPVSYQAITRIFFLDQIDMDNSLDDQMRDQGVRPMLALEQAFYDAIEESYKVDRISTGSGKTLSIFGNEDQDGVYEMIFDAELGGVEARPTLLIYKSVACKC